MCGEQGFPGGFVIMQREYGLSIINRGKDIHDRVGKVIDPAAFRVFH